MSPLHLRSFMYFLIVSRSGRRLVELHLLFFLSIWKVRRRRFSSDPLEPITEMALEELGRQFRSPRLASCLGKSPKGDLAGMIDSNSGSMSPTLLA
ncbi:BZ3500_MvSof-1268-A1-R1_Chr6-3g09018 [Microbotryum saponariae]|uniref:BZ3500_MvSof-1268-A1-R1_Chr6-3g09018 protein n=1 Tax=Microbotryum saponariae TaxID=289078 RepID=A0A2X0LQ31_9BASI|nr:BZ3500_MvSof-1268-A1-R1_Chr6-3g09018 [Microbotryum saponariae]SDA07620.1 BZ3501_MvSof-1269-A2-R1_Chr6-2g08722 [Microbotryum saponariae]